MILQVNMPGKLNFCLSENILKTQRNYSSVNYVNTNVPGNRKNFECVISFVPIA